MISVNLIRLSHAEEINEFFGMKILLSKGYKQGYFALYRQCAVLIFI